MRKTRHGKMRVIWDNIPSLVKDIWAGVGKRHEMTWRLPNRKTLKGIISDADIKSLYSITDSADANRRMREILSPYLRDRAVQRPTQRHIYDEKAAALATWIVKEWGGIKVGFEAIPDWTAELDNYSDEAVQAFVAKRQNSRVSSWSKILAFADAENHAIYDARTSVALNVVLSNLESRYRFYMPSTQNSDLPATMKIVKKDMDRIWKRRKNVYRGYDDYIRLLKAIVAYTDARDILEVEMTLFANGPSLATEYAKVNGWEYEVELEL